MSNAQLRCAFVSKQTAAEQSARAGQPQFLSFDGKNVLQSDKEIEQKNFNQVRQISRSEFRHLCGDAGLHKEFVILCTQLISHKKDYNQSDLIMYVTVISLQMNTASTSTTVEFR